MKIYHKIDYWKSYIPSDKITYNHIKFEDYSLANFGLAPKELNREYRAKPRTEKKNFITKVKLLIKDTQKYRDIVKDGYHTAYYLNFNLDTIQGYISR